MKKLKNKIKNAAQKLHKNLAAKVLAVSVVLATTVVPALAAEGDVASTVDVTAIKNSFVGGVGTMASTTIDILAATMPAALSIVSVWFVIKKGMSWIKKI